MENPDMKQKNAAELENKLKTALAAGDADGQAKALVELAAGIQSNILNEYNSMTAEMLADRNVLAGRGVMELTSKERKYYNAVIEGGGFGGTEELVPPTVINRVFEYLSQRHELLGLIKFQNVTATTRWLMRKGDVPGAWWGKLTSSLKEIIMDGFKDEDMTLFKLNAFIPVHKSMLAIGPEWLDRYVREVLGESMAIALEDAIIKGNGIDKPVGMMKAMTDKNETTGYPDKEAKELRDLSPASLGNEIMAPLTKNGKRAANDIVLVVNPLDFWKRIFPATAMLTQNGTFAYGVLSIPAKIVQCVAVPQGKMIAGIASDYFMGVGADQRMEKSDEALFIEDQRVYAQRMIANGRPIDNDSFLVFDITKLVALQDDFKSVYFRTVEDSE